MADSKSLPNYTKFLSAAFAGIGATLVCYPLEMLKTRKQVIGEGVRSVRITTYQLIKNIVNQEGFRGLYSGLSASCLRQASYTAVRLGSYQSFIDYFTEDGKPPDLATKALCGVVSGAAGGVAGLPADVSLTRMAADGNAPPEKRRNYAHVFDAMIKIFREEGFKVLFRGLYPTCFRAIVANLSQLVSYGSSKEILIKYGITGDDTACHVLSSLCSALISTTCVLPPDMAKTRMQNMVFVNGKPQYNGMIDVWVKTVTKEGFFALWKGCTPAFVRNGPHFIVFFVLYEKIIYAFKIFVFEAGNSK